MCSLLLSASVVMAGTCDVRCMQVAKALRKRLHDSKTYHYGFNLAIHLAAGLLCLGMGKYSLQNSDQAIAALLVTVYPVFPSHPGDNAYHLQALRHFYVLAVKKKTFHAVDMDTGEALPLTLDCEFRHPDGSISREPMQSPFLQQDSRRLLAVHLADPCYYELSFSF